MREMTSYGKTTAALKEDAEYYTTYIIANRGSDYIFRSSIYFPNSLARNKHEQNVNLLLKFRIT